MGIIVYVERTIGWARLCDLTLDCGPRCVDGLKNLVRRLTFTPHSQSLCLLCEERNLSGARDDLLSSMSSMPT